MSAKEKFDSLVQEEEVQKGAEIEIRRAQEQLEAAQRIEDFKNQQAERERIRKLYEEGLPAAEQEQIRLFNRLKKVGVVRGLTEITGRQYFGPRKSIRNITGYRIKPSLADEVLDENGWRVNVVDPVMDSTGVWEKGLLRIRAMNTDKGWIGHNVEVVGKDHVSINYFESGKLVIAGDQENFNGFVEYKNPSTEQTEQVEWALAKAFHQPLREDLSHSGQERAIQKAFRDELVQHYGEKLGKAVGAFIFDHFQPESQPQINEALARAFIEKFNGSPAEQLLAVVGFLEAIRSGTRDEFSHITKHAEWARRHSQVILSA